MTELSKTGVPNPQPAVPKDAAAVILVREATDGSRVEVFWARRGASMAFLPGFYAFPGGQRDDSDSEVRVDNANSPSVASMIACAARELFEELGILAARGTGALTVGQRSSLLDDLTSGRMTFAAMLDHYGLHLDANDFTFVGRWVTPPFSPRRFDTFFFLVTCPRKQRPDVLTPEFESGEWVMPELALARWRRAESLAVPPVIHALKCLATGMDAKLVDRFLQIPQSQGSSMRAIEFLPGFVCFPVRTPTRPPATTTNCYIVGHREFVVIDPASPYDDEQLALHRYIDEQISEGRTLREIILTHLHPDHVGGSNALREHLNGRVPVSAHRLTAEPLAGSIVVDRLIDEGDVIELDGETRLALRVMHTPGHARGHLSFYEENVGALIAGDNIVGIGSVLIDLPEGNMRDYFATLERFRALPHLSVLFGGHGPAVANPRAKIDEYISHRLEREQNILFAVRQGARDTTEIVAQVYTDVHPKMHGLAERAVLAHLEKLEADGLVSSEAGALVAQ